VSLAEPPGAVSLAHKCSDGFVDGGCRPTSCHTRFGQHWFVRRARRNGQRELQDRTVEVIARLHLDSRSREEPSNSSPTARSQCLRRNLNWLQSWTILGSRICPISATLERALTGWRRSGPPKLPPPIPPVVGSTPASCKRPLRRVTSSRAVLTGKWPRWARGNGMQHGSSSRLVFPAARWNLPPAAGLPDFHADRSTCVAPYPTVPEFELGDIHWFYVLLTPGVLWACASSRRTSARRVRFVVRSKHPRRTSNRASTTLGIAL